jgi:hypothetical protein
MNRVTVVVTVACALATASPAAADVDYAAYAAKAEIAARAGAKFSFAAVNRVRRSIALGPLLGVYGGTSIVPTQDFGSGVTFGMALYTFHIPSILDIDKLLEEQLEVAVKAEAARIVAEGGVPDFKAIAKKAYESLKEDLVGKIHPRTLEKPKLGIVIEGVAQFKPGNALGARLSLMYGVGPASLGLGAGFLRGGNNTSAYVGPELSVRLTPIGKSWTPVFDLYARFDIGFDEGERPYLITVGGRALLDLI